MFTQIYKKSLNRKHLKTKSLSTLYTQA